MKKIILAMTILAASSAAWAQSAIWHRSGNTEWQTSATKPMSSFFGVHPGSMALFNHDYGPQTPMTPHQNWNVNDFTDSGITMTPYSQISYNTAAAGYGSMSMQIGNGRAAYFMNSYDNGWTDGTPARAGWYGAQAPVQQLKSDTKIDIGVGGAINQNTGYRNWNLSRRAQVCVSANYKMNYFGGESDKAIQSYFGFFIYDHATGKEFNVTFNIWDNRIYTPTDGAGGSEIGRYVHGYFGNSAFMTKQSGSADTMRGTPVSGYTWYHGCITRQNLVNIINKYNESPEVINKMSNTNLGNYELKGVYLQTEMMKLRWFEGYVGGTYQVWGRFSNAYRDLAPYNQNARSHIGVTWKDHNLVTLY